MYLISLGEHTGYPSPFRIWWKTRNSSIRPMGLHPERPCDFMAEIPAWANHCDPCCDLETRWMCWRPDYPRKKKTKWSLYWSLVLPSGGSEHSPGRTKRDWFTLTPAELVQSPGKAGFSGSWGKEKLICLPRWDHPSYCNFIFGNSPGLKPIFRISGCPRPALEQQKGGTACPLVQGSADGFKPRISCRIAKLL